MSGFMMDIPGHDDIVTRSPAETGWTDEEIEKALKDATPCPGCASKRHLILVEDDRGSMRVHCDEDGWDGPWRSDPRDAMDQWNNRATVRSGK